MGVISAATTLLLSASLLAGIAPLVTESTSSTAVADLIATVSGERMMATIQDLEEFGSRAFYANGSREAADYIQQRFEALHLDTMKQEFTVGGFESSNVIAMMEGTDPDTPCFLFGAHYDSENMNAENLTLAETLPAPGADDDASGVATVVELATVLAGTEIKNTIKFVAFGAEEAGFDQSGGLAGSSVFVLAEKANGTAYAGTVIFDMVGYKAGAQNYVMGFVNSASGQLPWAIESAVSEHSLDLVIELVDAPWMAYSDHYPFWLAGYPSMLMIEELDNTTYAPLYPHYHTQNDTSDKLSPDQIAEIAKATVAGLVSVAEREGGSDFTIYAIAATVAGGSVAAVLVYHRRRQARVQ